MVHHKVLRLELVSVWLMAFTHLLLQASESGRKVIMLSLEDVRRVIRNNTYLLRQRVSVFWCTCSRLLFRNFFAVD